MAGAGFRSAVIVALTLPLAARSARAQRAAVPDDFPGITQCERGRAVSRIRADVRDSLLRAQLEAHEADIELPAYCAQWRVAVGQGAEPVETRRDFAWRIAAQSGAMENRLQVVQRFERECDLVLAGARAP